MNLRIARALGATIVAASVAGLFAQERFQSGVEVVTVPVAVTNSNRPVPGLTAADFVLTDNGVRQTIEAVSVESLPIDVTLLLDASSSVRGDMLTRLKAAVTSTAELLAPSDRLRLISVQHLVHQVLPWQPGGRAPDLSTLTAAGSTSLYDGLAAAMMRRSPTDRRQLIVAYTDAFDTSSIVSPSTVTTIAGSTDAVVHAVVVIDDLASLRSNRVPTPGVTSLGGRASVAAGLSSADEQQLPPARTMHDTVTGPTGGRVFPVDPKDPIGRAFADAIRDFRTSYVLRYTPQGVAPGGWHALGVSIPRSGNYDVRARKGYGG